VWFIPLSPSLWTC